MNENELLSLLKDLESDRVERKVSASSSDKIKQAICAFANDMPNHQQPGVVFIGVTDDGKCANLAITDELLLLLAGMRSDGNIIPIPTMIVQKVRLDGCEIAVVIVEPADAPPVRYQGRVWIRIGPRRDLATPEDERRLSEKRRARDLPFDIRPIVPSTLADLDLELFLREYVPSSLANDVLAENNRPVEQKLASLRFTSPAPDSTPTSLGLLVVGKDSREFLPGAYIQFLRIDGKELTDPIKDQAEISGPLAELLTKLEDKLQAHISVAADIVSQSQELRRPDYPMISLQQLVRNAVLHRSYEGTNSPIRITWFNDRIEIQNPGGPFGQVTKLNFGQGLADYRNPHLAAAMKDLGYVQRFGVGIALARNALKKNGNPELEYSVDDSYVLATVRK